jgi:hypothetical protein
MDVKVGSQTVAMNFAGIAATPIPYTFTIGAVTFAGTLYLRDPLTDSYTDGFFAGVVAGTYHLAKDHSEVCGNNGLLQACIKLDINHKKLYGRICTRNIRGKWDCGDWQEIASW